MSTSLLAALGVAQATAPAAKISDTESERSKVILRGKVPLKVSERSVSPDEVSQALAGAAKRRSLQDYQAMSDAGKAAVDPELVDHDEVARRILDQAGGPASTANSGQSVAALRDSHDFFLFRISGDLVGSAEAATRPTTPQPTRLITQESHRASLRVIKENSASQGGQTTFTNLFQTSDFFLQSVQEYSREKFQIVETFGPPVLYFFDEQPRIWTFSGVMFNARNLNHANNFWQDYTRELRGTKLAEAGARAYLSYDKQVLEGYLLSFDLQRSADLQHGVTFSFTMYVRGQHFIGALSDKGERVMDERALESLETGEYRAYEQGEDPFTTAQWIDRETSIDPMGVQSLAELEESDKGQFAADGNAQKELASERFLLSYPGSMVPISGFVALSKDAVAEAQLLSVSFSDPLADEACMKQELRGLLNEKPEGLLPVPQQRTQPVPGGGAGPPQQVPNWSPSRSSAIKRVVVLDTNQQGQTDNAVLSGMSSGSRPAPHYFVARGDSQNPSTNTNLRDGQIIQLVQENYTAHLMGQIPESDAGPLPDDKCIEGLLRLFEPDDDRHFIPASALDQAAAAQRFNAEFTQSQAEQVPNASVDMLVRNKIFKRVDIVEAGGNVVGHRYTCDVSIENILSSRLTTEGESKSFTEKMLVNLLGKTGAVRLNDKTIVPWQLMSIMAVLLYEMGTSGRYAFEGEAAIGRKTGRGNPAGIAQLLYGEAIFKYGLEITRGLGGTGLSVPSGRPVEYNGNIVPEETKTFTSGGPGGGTRTRKFLPDGAYTWRMSRSRGGPAIDMRFSPLHAVPAAYARLVRLIRAQVLASGVRKTKTLADAAAFALAAWRYEEDGKDGTESIIEARKKAGAANPDGGARFCATFPPDDPGRHADERSRYGFAKRVMERINSVLDKNPNSSELTDLTATSRVTKMDPLESNIDAGTIYVMLSGPATLSKPYTSKQVCAATRLVNNIACRNGAVVSGDKVLGRKHVAGVVKAGDELQLRYHDPYTVNRAATAAERANHFDFGDVDSTVQQCQLEGNLKDGSLNAEKTQYGKKNNWWVEPS